MCSQNLSTYKKIKSLHAKRLTSYREMRSERQHFLMSAPPAVYLDIIFHFKCTYLLTYLLTHSLTHTPSLTNVRTYLIT